MYGSPTFFCFVMYDVIPLFRFSLRTKKEKKKKEKKEKKERKKDRL
jgi:hypothetical protein